MQVNLISILSLGPPPPPVRPTLLPPVRPRPRRKGEECDHISSQTCKFNCEPCEPGLECVRNQPPSNGIQPRNDIAICRQPILSPQPRQEGEECGLSSTPACNSDCGPCAPGLECVKQDSSQELKNNGIQPRNNEIPSFCQLIEAPIQTDSTGKMFLIIISSPVLTQVFYYLIKTKCMRYSYFYLIPIL